MNKPFLKFYQDRKGAMYLETIIGVMVSVFLMVILVNAVAALTLQSNLNQIADATSKQISIDGSCSKSDLQQYVSGNIPDNTKFVLLDANDNTLLTISSRSKADGNYTIDLPFNQPFKVVLTTEFSIGIGSIAPYDIELGGYASKVSEVYSK